MSVLNRLKLKIGSSKIASNLLLLSLNYQVTINDRYNISNVLTMNLLRKVINFYRYLSLNEYHNVERNFNNYTKLVIKNMKGYYCLAYSDIASATVFLESMEKDLSLLNNEKSITNYNLIDKNMQISLQNIKVKHWISSIEKKLINLNSQINSNNKIIEQCYIAYNMYEVNSEEHLNISRKHLESYMDSLLLSNTKIDILSLSPEEKETGEDLLRNTIILIENINSSIKIQSHRELLLNKALLLKLKLNFYLGKEHKDLIKSLGDFCHFQVKKGNLDPIGTAMGLYDYPLINKLDKDNHTIKFSELNEEKEFINYLKSFLIEISKKENLANFKLQQLSNFETNSIKERVNIKIL